MADIKTLTKRAEEVDFGAVAAMMCGEELSETQKEEIKKVRQQYDEVVELKTL